MKKFSVVLMALLMAFGVGATTASAKMYISGNLGAVFASDADIDDGFDTGEITFDTGVGLTVAIGNAFDNGFRAEVELAYRANDIDKISVDGVGSASVKGDVTTLSLMANGYYHFFIPESALSPFLGAGIGVANIEGDIDNFDSEDDTVFAYQLAAGLSYAASAKLSVDLQYRLFATTDPDFKGLEAEYSTHNLLLGLRYSF